jgi:hypothetical protein
MVGSLYCVAARSLSKKTTAAKSNIPVTRIEKVKAGRSCCYLEKLERRNRFVKFRPSSNNELIFYFLF